MQRQQWTKNGEKWRLSNYSLVHKFIPMPQAFKIPDAKAAVDKLKKMSAWQLTKGRDKESVRSPLAGLLCETQFEKVMLEDGWEKVLNWECFFVNRARGLFILIRECG